MKAEDTMITFLPIPTDKKKVEEDEILHIAMSNLVKLLASRKREGIMEVVEWIEAHRTLHFFDPFWRTPRLERWMSSVNNEDWKAKLKEWGVKG